MMTEEKNKFLKLGKVKEVKGSIVNPENGGLRFVLSINNMVGKPEGNPLLSVFDRKWPKVRAESKGWYGNKDRHYVLGAVHNVAVQSDVWVNMMLVQSTDLNVDLVGLKKALEEVQKQAAAERASVHVSNVLVDKVPELKQLVTTCLVEKGTSVYFYEEPV